MSSTNEESRVVSFNDNENSVMLDQLWGNILTEVRELQPLPADVKNLLVPFGRVKKIMKTVEVALQEIKRNADNQEGSADATDESRKAAIFLLAAEVPHVMGKAVEMFIRDITTRAWMHADQNRRKTIQKPDIIHATRATETYDFLIDVVHGLTNPADRDDTATTTDTTTDVTHHHTTNATTTSTVAVDRTHNVDATTTVTATNPTAVTSPAMYNMALWHPAHGMSAQQQQQDPPPLPNSTEQPQNLTDNNNNNNNDSNHQSYQESYSSRSTLENSHRHHQNNNEHPPEERLPHIPLHHADLLLFSPTVEQTPLPPPHPTPPHDDKAPPDDWHPEDPTFVRAGGHSTNYHFDASLQSQPWTLDE